MSEPLTSAEIERTLVGAAASCDGGAQLAQLTGDLIRELVEHDLVDELVLAVASLAARAAFGLAAMQLLNEERDPSVAAKRGDLSLVQAQLLARAGGGS